MSFPVSVNVWHSSANSLGGYPCTISPLETLDSLMQTSTKAILRYATDASSASGRHQETAHHGRILHIATSKTNVRPHLVSNRRYISLTELWFWMHRHLAGPRRRNRQMTAVRSLAGVRLSSDPFSPNERVHAASQFEPMRPGGGGPPHR